jgi:inosine-uridine nucleoside N-ribohydrolase
MVLNLKIEKYLIPINVCRKVFFNSEDFNNIKNSKLSSSIKEITKQYIKYYTTNKEY